MNIRETGSQMIDLLQDLDELLQTESNFLLGRWIADAKSCGTTEEVFNYEFLFINEK